MGAEETQDGRGSTRARAMLRERIGELPEDEAVRIVGAGTTPTVLFEGNAADAGAALGGLESGPGQRQPRRRRCALAAGLRAGNDDKIALLRAPEEARHRKCGGGSSYEDLEVGELGGKTPRSPAPAPCDRLGEEECEVFVRVAGCRREPTTNAAVGRDQRRAIHTVAGREDPARRRRRRSSSPPPPGPRCRMSLPGGDGLAEDDSAFVSVPKPGGENITLVGNRIAPCRWPARSPRCRG